MSLVMFLLTFIGWFNFAASTITVTPREATIYLRGSVVLSCTYPDDIEVEWFLQIGTSNPLPLASNNDKACLKDKKTVEGKHAIHRQSDTVCVLGVNNLERNVTYRCMSRSDSQQDKAVIVVLDAQEPPSIESNTNPTSWIAGLLFTISACVVTTILLILYVILKCRKSQINSITRLSKDGLDEQSSVTKYTGVPQSHSTAESEHLYRREVIIPKRLTVDFVGEQQLHAAGINSKGISLSVGAGNVNSSLSKVKMDNSNRSSFSLRSALTSNPGTSADSSHSTGDLSAEQKMEIKTQIENTLIFKQSRNADILIETGNLIELLKELVSDAIECKLTIGVKKFQDMEYYTGKLNIESICNVDEDVKSFNDGSQFQSKAKSRREYNAAHQYERRNKIDAERKQKVSGRPVGVSESSIDSEYHVKLLIVEFLGSLSSSVLDDISYAERKAWDLKFQQDGAKCQYHRQCYVIEKIKNFKEIICEQWCRAHVELLLSESGKGCSRDGIAKDIRGFIFQKERYEEEIDETVNRELVRLNYGSCTCHDADLEANNAVGGVIEHRTGAATAAARNDQPLYRTPIYSPLYKPDQACISDPQVGAVGAACIAVEANSNLIGDAHMLEETNNCYPLPVEDFEMSLNFYLREDSEIELEGGSEDNLKISEESLKSEPHRSITSKTKISGNGSLTNLTEVYKHVCDL